MFKSFLAALGRAQLARHEAENRGLAKPAPPPVVNLVQPASGPMQSGVGNVIPAPPPAVNRVAPVTGMRRDTSLQAIYAAAGGNEDQAVEAFLALTPQAQYLAIEAEMANLAPQEKIDLYGLLKPQLDKKWLPLPGPQTAAMQSEADILLYGGAGGGGKSEFLLGCAISEHKRSLIMRRQAADLTFLTERLVQINRTRNGFAASPRPVLKTTDGRMIEFGSAQNAGDEQSWQGRPHSFLGIDEAAQFHESQVRYLMGWVRSTEAGERCRVVLASNPPLSDEGQWLIAMFRPWLDPGHAHPAKAGELRYFITDEDGVDEEVDGPGPFEVGGREVKALSRTFIPAKLIDNPYLSRTDYAAKLDALQEPLRSAIRDGDFLAARQDDAWQVVPSEWIKAAQGRWKDVPPGGQGMTCIALDPAGGGKDAAAIAARYGAWFAEVETIKGKDTGDGRFVGAQLLMRRKNNCQTVIDLGGGYGSVEVGVLRDNDAPVTGFKGSDGSSGKAEGSRLPFANLRAETWWRFREALDPRNPEKIALPVDQELAADLSSPRLSARAMQVRGVIQVESKEEIRERLGRSPDKGDAVTMCWAYGGALEMDRKEVSRQKSFANVGHMSSKQRSSGYDGRNYGRPAFAKVAHGASKGR